MYQNGNEEAAYNGKPTSEEMVQLVIAILHNHVTMLETYWNAALFPVLRIFGESPFLDEAIPTVEEAGTILASPIKSLYISIEQIMNISKSRNMPENVYDEIVDFYYMYEKFSSIYSLGPHNLIDIQHTSRRIIEFSKELLSLQLLPREKIKEIRTIAESIEKICCYYHLLQVEDRVRNLQKEATSLRDILIAEFNTTNQIVYTDFTIINFLKLLEQVVTNIEPMANKYRIEIRTVSKPYYDIFVEGVENEIKRAIFNLLSNAIKYSFTLGNDQRAWVDIKVEMHNEKIALEIENWGVPIDQDDIDSKRIFNFMQRGRKSGLGARTGTGIGLWDTTTVIKKHGGELFITSHPSRVTDSKTKIIPYITTARVELPIKYKKRNY